MDAEETVSECHWLEISETKHVTQTEQQPD